MLSSTLRTSRLVSTASARLLHASSVTLVQTTPGRDPRLSQGHVSNPNNDHPGDPHDQAARSGQRIAHAQEDAAGPYDAASRVNDKKADYSDFGGNKEGVGFADQVGSASSSADKDELRPSPDKASGRQEEITPPGIVATLKDKLGLGTSVDDAKQNRGGGIGVTGSGSPPLESKPQADGRRPFHTSAARAAAKTTGQAPEASRQPKERTNAEQNPHLKHKAAGSSTPDKGKGNAADDPKLPSHQISSSDSQRKRSFSTSVPRAGDKKDDHSADSYFKDVDKSPPSSQKTYQVDGSGTGSNVERPNESMSGEWSRAGADTKEYKTVDRNGQYDVPPSGGPEEDQKLRYGNMPNSSTSESTDKDVSKPDEGPEGSSRGGRKPEGRS